MVFSNYATTYCIGNQMFAANYSTHSIVFCHTSV